MGRYNFLYLTLMTITAIFMTTSLLFPLWGTILILKIIKASTLPSIVWWIIHSLGIIIWIGTIIITVKEIKKIIKYYYYY